MVLLTPPQFVQTGEDRSAVTPPLTSVWSRLVIVEGIMGSGKSTNTQSIARRLDAQGIPAIGITEGVRPHPIRLNSNLPWSETKPAELANSCIAKWRSFVDRSLAMERVSVVDGQLFHGNLTTLFLLEADFDLIAGYCRDVVAVIKPPSPLLVYFHQEDVDSAIHAVSTQRGETWVNYQINWKLESPYAKRRGLAGLDGLIVLYRHYRALTDQLFADVEIPKISIENSRQEWAIYDGMIDRALNNVNAISKMPI
ncbi:hypothetical protein [Bradyrhizobium prioriisuperbiae]|uniref:hypothetical protein n=1 Tax=Bradyrhizobium prioriisuperbiae TaxID=2854389 RepID=UPI0028F074CA|nr:hypothetical protein [Bradyrhizobium prioritasuperba]